MATKASAQNVDFSNVKDGGNFNKGRIPAGDYLATITKVEDAESKKDGAFQYLISIKINKKPSSVFPYYCKLQENQLWKLRNILIAAGIQVPKRRIKVDPNRLVGKVIGVTVEDADFDGKDQSEIGGVFPASELSDGHVDDPNAEDDEDATEEEDNLEDLEDEEPEDDDEAEADDEPIDPYAELDRAALKAELKKRDSAFQARKSQTDDDLRALLREGDGAADEDDEEEEDEPTPPPAKKAAPARRARRKAAAPKPEEVTDEELEELDIDDL